MATSLDVTPRDFSVAVEPQPGACIVAVSGEIDLSTAPALASAVTEAATHNLPIIVDLCDVPFCDSSGLRTLLEERERIVLSCVPDGPVRRLIEISGTRDLFPSYDSREDAVRAVA